jgi:3-hydroxyacyl-CoA dehydrogenase
VFDGIAVLEVDNPPVNPLSDGVRHGLVESMEKAESDDSVVGIVLTGKGRSFIAGADISEFGQQIEGPSIHDAFEKIESSSKPVVAAINGSALGGGLETALCCNYRVSSKQGFIGLPEVNLGLLPGAGGTQRLPRLVGPAEALKIMLSGRHIPAVKALDMGVIDSLSEGNIVDDAFAFARKVAEKNDIHPQVRHLNEKVVAARGDENIISEARALAATTFSLRCLTCGCISFFSATFLANATASSTMFPSDNESITPISKALTAGICLPDSIILRASAGPTRRGRR